MTDLHRECWDALPWLANERLSSEELARIDGHLQQCRDCQEELRAQQRLREAIRSDDSLVLAPHAGLQRLMLRIDTEERHGETAIASVESRQRRADVRRPWLAIAAAIQTLVIGILLGTLGWQSYQTRSAPVYSTLTSKAPAVANGPVLRVVFEGSAPIEEVNELVRAIGAQVVTGPSEAGVYTLMLRGAGTQPTDFAAALAMLRGDRRVFFAEPAIAEVKQ